jgi:hypothetical protein
MGDAVRDDAPPEPAGHESDCRTREHPARYEDCQARCGPHRALAGRTRTRPPTAAPRPTALTARLAAAPA